MRTSICACMRCAFPPPACAHHAFSYASIFPPPLPAFHATLAPPPITQGYPMLLLLALTCLVCGVQAEPPACGPWQLPGNTTNSSCIACPLDMYCDGLRAIPCVPGHCNVTACAASYVGAQCAACAGGYYSDVQLVGGNLLPTCRACSALGEYTSSPISRYLGMFAVGALALLAALHLLKRAACPGLELRLLVERIHPITRFVVFSQVSRLSLLYNIQGIPFPSNFRGSFLPSVALVGLNFDGFSLVYPQCWNIQWNILWTWLSLLLGMGGIMMILWGVYLFCFTLSPSSSFSSFVLIPAAHLLQLQVLQRSLQLLTSATVNGNLVVAYDPTVPWYSTSLGLSHKAIYDICMYFAVIDGLVFFVAVFNFVRIFTAGTIKLAEEPSFKNPQTTGFSSMFLPIATVMPMATAREEQFFSAALFLAFFEVMRQPFAVANAFSILVGPSDNIGTSVFCLALSCMEFAISMYYFYWQQNHPN